MWYASVCHSHTYSELLLETDRSSLPTTYLYLWVFPWCADGLMKAKTWLGKRGMSKIVSLKVMQQKMSFAFTFSVLTTTSSVWSSCKSGTLRELPFHFILGETFLLNSACKELGVIFPLLLNGWECRAWSESELRVAAFTDLWAILYVAFSGPESYTKSNTTGLRPIPLVF